MNDPMYIIFKDWWSVVMVILQICVKIVYYVAEIANWMQKQKSAFQIVSSKRKIRLNKHQVNFHLPYISIYHKSLIRSRPCIILDLVLEALWKVQLLEQKIFAEMTEGPLRIPKKSKI